MGKTNVAEELGLDDAATTAATASTETAAVATRAPVKVGEIKTVKFSSIPGITRKGHSSGETKYAFDQLAAPEATGDADSPWNYDARDIAYDPEETPERFSRSIQTAYTKANKDAKDAGKKTHFIGRKYYAEDDGKLAGMYVFRVDDTIADDDEPEAAAS